MVSQHGGTKSEDRMEMLKMARQCLSYSVRDTDLQHEIFAIWLFS